MNVSVLGAIVLMQDRENVANMWRQNQHTFHIQSTCTPRITHAHIFSTVFPTCNQQIAHELSTTPHLLFILPTQKSTFDQQKIGLDHELLVLFCQHCVNSIFYPHSADALHIRMLVFSMIRLSQDPLSLCVE